MDVINLYSISIIFLPKIIFGQNQNNFEQLHTISIIPKFDIEIYPRYDQHNPAEVTGVYPLSFDHPVTTYPVFDHSRYPILQPTHPQQFWQYQTGPTYSHDYSSGTQTISYANVQVTQHHHQHFTIIHAYAIASVQISIPTT
uniref:Uncharacterized protein n=1 Tax=Panagrolaimus sp. PS1159 TaxID=55785 RepID=A0AC35GDA6_9BILA